VPIYNCGQSPAARQAADAPVREADAEREQEAQCQTLKLQQVYSGQQLAQQTVEVRSAVPDGLQRHLEDAMRLEEAGFATRAQRLQATVARDQAERDYRQARNQLDTISASLADLLRSPRPVAT